ncbi:MAG: S8 family serine peptidase, partial [Anaerolineae bacterium]|nr:S8 family serine peptidase [Anaerolineae bacterium]
MNRITLKAGLGVLLMVLVLIPATAQVAPLPFPETPPVYVNEWAVTLAAGADPDQTAARLGMVNLGAVGALPNVYRFAYPDNALRAQAAPDLRQLPDIDGFVQQTALERELRGVADTLTDPLFANQWYLRNTGQLGGTAGNDANVVPAWDMGYTGAGVIVASVDDGLWWANPDILPNYRADLSYDYALTDDDPAGGGHGTSVAGVMAGADDGAACGVGVAFDAQISGVRLFGGTITDAKEASAISHQNADIHVYNNSWGPIDNGRTLGAPGALTEAALQANVTNGRGGLGAITVWAAGNGTTSDNVNADGYANHRTVITVGGSTNTGGTPWYAEPGAPILINAPTNGGTAGLYTTGYSISTCNTAFGGTSGAAPVVAGVVALMLEANPSLTWRDVKHILVETAVKNNPTHPDWQLNGAGRNINHTFGFGRVDAAAAVALASTWANVATETSTATPTQPVNTAIPDGTGAWVSQTITLSQNLSVEHVDLVVNINHGRRSDLEIELVSPSGTVSRMMYGRQFDSGANFAQWRLSSARHWGEASAGTWTVRVRDIMGGTTGTWQNWQLTVYGTVQDRYALLPSPRWQSTDLAPFQVRNPSRDQVVCNGNHATAPCAFRFIGSANEQAVLTASFPIIGRNLPLSVGGTWEVRGQANIAPNARVRVIVRQYYPVGNGWVQFTTHRRTLNATAGWQAFAFDAPLARPDIAWVEVSFANLTKTNARAWLDDLNVYYRPTSAPAPLA